MGMKLIASYCSLTRAISEGQTPKIYIPLPGLVYW